MPRPSPEIELRVLATLVADPARARVDPAAYLSRASFAVPAHADAWASLRVHGGDAARALTRGLPPCPDTFVDDVRALVERGRLVALAREAEQLAALAQQALVDGRTAPVGAAIGRVVRFSETFPAAPTFVATAHTRGLRVVGVGSLWAMIAKALRDDGAPAKVGLVVAEADEADVAAAAAATKAMAREGVPTLTLDGRTDAARLECVEMLAAALQRPSTTPLDASSLAAVAAPAGGARVVVVRAPQARRVPELVRAHASLAGARGVVAYVVAPDGTPVADVDALFATVGAVAAPDARVVRGQRASRRGDVACLLVYAPGRP